MNARSSVTPLPRTFALVATLLAGVALSAGCGEKTKDGPGAGLVPEAGPVVAATPEAGAPATVDINTCAGCQLTPTPAWTFEGIYKDSACTDPVAQIATPSCGQVPAAGQVNITYVDAVGGRKANESATVALTDILGAEVSRFRKAGTACVRANESATDITPAACSGQKVCRDATGALACANCRTFANGCPDFIETRTYASINDPTAKGAAGGGGGGGNSLARLKQCCAALAGEAKRLGASPEAGMINSAAQQCNTLVAAAGPSGTAPELGALRTILQGRNIPAICAGF